MAKEQKLKREEHQREKTKNIGRIGKDGI